MGAPRLPRSPTGDPCEHRELPGMRSCLSLGAEEISHDPQQGVLVRMGSSPRYARVSPGEPERPLRNPTGPLVNAGSSSPDRLRTPTRCLRDHGDPQGHPSGPKRSPDSQQKSPHGQGGHRKQILTDPPWENAPRGVCQGSLHATHATSRPW